MYAANAQVGTILIRFAYLLLKQSDVNTVYFVTATPLHLSLRLHTNLHKHPSNVKIMLEVSDTQPQAYSSSVPP